MRFYEKQGVPFHSGFLPFLGHYYELIKFQKKNNPTLHPLIEYIQTYFDQKPPVFSGIIFSQRLCLFVNRPEALRELFVSKNRFFDKHPSSGNILKKIAGDSIAFQKSNQIWAKKRKVISSSLYKQKLIVMLDIMKEIVLETKDQWAKQGTIDIVQETSNMMMTIILACAFGRQNENPLINYKEKGEIRQIQLGQALSTNLGRAIEREFQPYLIFFPELFPYYLSILDQEVKYNAEQVIEYIRKIIQIKRVNFAQTGHYEGDDLLSVLLQDDVFQDSDQMIIDECITFFIAGSQTIAVAISNFLSYMAQSQEHENQIRMEFGKLLQNYGMDIQKLAQELDLRKIEEFEYLKCCYNETLRIEPPLIISSSVQLTEDQQIAGVNIKQDDMLIINIYQIHHNKDQWIDDEKFIPERFNPQSQYYLTPAGTQRDQFSFVPFLGGKRICLGKTFAENAFKIIVPLLMNNYKFVLCDDKQKIQKPFFNAIMFKRPQVFMKLERIN
ncbi:cytochrome p450 [Stylonychia lemnae]|uniref:Cytochrome p450 n=1 Tax=Stylonychia lemnae TaxID=5949 RepID=A0A078AE16_STYLE|nr:cytochrome p450 [Stylonychia lemnae]|eukprot:CDW80479.1 cytochrome p450 [Stylonychia lemnae]